MLAIRPVSRCIGALALCSGVYGSATPMTTNAGVAPLTRGNEQIDYSPRLALSTQPSVVEVGMQFQLTIAYRYIGFWRTDIHMDHPELAEYEPALEMPCQWDQHGDKCMSISLKAIAAGVVEFTAVAFGEIWDSTCMCWLWADVKDDGAARIVIVDELWRIGLPTIGR